MKTDMEERYGEIAFPIGEQNPVASFSKTGLPAGLLQDPPS